MKLFNSVILFISMALFAGCATTYKDFKTSHVEDGQAVVIGQVNVLYNGKKLNKECSICLNSVNGPCQKLTEEGYMFKNIPQGEASIRRVACLDQSLQHYNFQGATFQVKPGVNYIGTIDIDWSTKGGFKVSNMFGIFGAIADESSNDGVAKMSIKDMNMSEVVKVYEQQTQQSKIPVNKSLAKVGQ